MINPDDFYYMYRGKPIRPLPEAEIKQLHNINIIHEGNTRALLLLHGFSSSPAVYRALWPMLKDYNALVCPALPGHAMNLEAFTQATAKAWLTAAEAACRPLMEHYEHVEIIGLSLGGLLACHLANQFPISHLYLLAPALKLRFNINLAKGVAQFLLAFGVKHIKNRAGNLHTHLHDELAYRKLPLRTLIELFNLIDTFNFSTPACNTDLFLGSHDDVVDSPSVMKQFEAHPNCTTHWLDHSAHALPLDGDIDAITACVNSRA
jgi:carboxylesterase